MNKDVIIRRNGRLLSRLPASEEAIEVIESIGNVEHDQQVDELAAVLEEWSEFDAHIQQLQQWDNDEQQEQQRIND